MANRYRHIDRAVVRAMLTQWPSARTGGLLAAMGYDKEMVRQRVSQGDEGALWQRFSPLTC